MQTIGSGQKLYGLHEFVANYRSSHRRCSVEKGILKNFANFTGKDLYWSIVLINLRTHILKNIC